MTPPRAGARPLFGYPKFWAHQFGTAPVLPMSRSEMQALGWECCDIILVTGDAYVDHPSFGAALIGRLLEAQGYRVGIISQPNWRNTDAFEALGAPSLMFGITAGNMDSLVNHYTSDKKPRSDDAYTPGGKAGQRPDRACIVYSQRCREAYPDVPIVLGGIEASLRRVAHYDYWSDKVRRSILADAGVDLLVFGNGERAIVEIAHRLARGEALREMRQIRGTALRSNGIPPGFVEVDSVRLDSPGPIDALPSPYQEAAPSKNAATPPAPLVTLRARPARIARDRVAVRLPSHADVSRDKALYAHASRVIHLESNPGNARALVQRNGDFEIWLNPPPLPLSSNEMDAIYELPYSRVPHPWYGAQSIPAYQMIRFSVTIQRGCFGGCTFCSITEHEGRIIQNRSEASILREIEAIRDQTPGFTGVISDLGGPTANMYRLACKSRDVEAKCRRLSCVYPGICSNLNTDHAPLISLYRRAREVRGVKKVMIASGVRYDLAVESPGYVRELVTHHVGGYLKIAPEHVSERPLRHMMKPGVGSYERFKRLFERFSREAGKKQYLIPYFIAAHPGTTDEDMLELALWLKERGFKADQVQAFLPSPMASATAMYHTGKNPLGGASKDPVQVASSPRNRRLHKAFLRYHDPDNWPLLRSALRKMGRSDLIGEAASQLVPRKQPPGWRSSDTTRTATAAQQRKRKTFRTQHSR